MDNLYYKRTMTNEFQCLQLKNLNKSSTYSISENKPFIEIQVIEIPLYI